MDSSIRDKEIKKCCEGFKVCTITTDNLLISVAPYSLYALSPRLEEVTYPLGAWAYPPPNCGPLTVFDTFNNAESFQTEIQKVIEELKELLSDRNYSGTVIGRCFYMPSQESCIWFPCIPGFRPVRGGGVRLGKPGNYITAKNDLPQGTILASSVKVYSLIGSDYDEKK